MTVTVKPNVASTVTIVIKAVGAQGPPGSGAVWGGITGTLSDQADLKTQQDAQDTATGLKLARAGGTATALSEAEATQDLTAGVTGTATIDYVEQGLTILMNATETVFELGTWPETALESLTLQMIGACASIDYSDAGMQSMIGIGDMPASITTGPIQAEIWRMDDGAAGSNYYIKQTVAE